MLFNYHLKEMFSTVCFFFQKTNKTEKKAVRALCGDHAALAEIGTVTYCTL